MPVCLCCKFTYIGNDFWLKQVASHGSEVQILREKRRRAGVLFIPSDGVSRKSSTDKCGSWLASAAFLSYSLLFRHRSRSSRWTGDTLGTVFKLVLGCKVLKLSTVELWAVVCGESVGSSGL